MVFRDELVGIAQRRGARLQIVAGHRARLGYDPLSPAALTANFPDLPRYDVYVCGSESMAAATDRITACRRRPTTAHPPRVLPVLTAVHISDKGSAVKRVALALFSTVAGLVMLLDYKTHSATSAAAGSSDRHVCSRRHERPRPCDDDHTIDRQFGNSVNKHLDRHQDLTGTAVNTRYGPVQVQITVTNGKITAVNAVDYPQNDGRDQQINSYAIPQLNSEALAAQSAKIDMVSGATYTSSGYIAVAAERPRQGRAVT